jgi:hypothetical protein
MRELFPRLAARSPRLARGAPRPSGLAENPISRSRRTGAATPLLVLALVCFGCHAEPTPVTPKHAVDAYARAVKDKRYDDAYALLSHEARRLVTREEFQRRLERDPKETALLLAGLDASSSGATVRAIITGKNGETLELVYEGDAWRIEERAVDLYGQRTPRDALSSFVRAYDAKRWDVLLRFVPDSERAGMDEKVLEQAWQGEQKAEIAAIVEGLRASLLAAPIEELGGQASMTYAGGGTVELVSERGVWKIRDFK